MKNPKNGTEKKPSDAIVKYKPLEWDESIEPSEEEIEAAEKEEEGKYSGFYEWLEEELRKEKDNGQKKQR